MNAMLDHISTVQGHVDHMLEDVPAFQEHQFILQARQFVRGGSNPITYYAAVRESLLKVPGVERKTAMRLLIDIEMALINAADGELKKAIEARKNGDMKATKPTDLCRKYMKSLQLIVDRKRAVTQIHAHAVLTDLLCEQTLSEGDLNNPEYLDPYTGEYIFETIEDFEKAIPEQHEAGLDELLKFIGMAPDVDLDEHSTTTTGLSKTQKELLDQAARCRIDLGWGDKEAAAFIKANSEGFDQDSDGDPEVYDDYDPYTPPTMLPKELVLNKQLWWSARDAVGSFNVSRSRIFEEMKVKGVGSKAWHSTFRHLFTDSYGFKQMLDAITRVSAEDIVTGAALYLSLAGEYGIMEGDINEVRGRHLNTAIGDAFSNMLNYAEEWEDDLLQLTQDSLSPTSETDPRDFRDILDDVEDEETFSPAPIRETMPAYDPNPINTASWNIGFMRAVVNGADWKQAENSAWAQWRFEMSKEASQAYDQTFAQTNNRKAAMAAFWRVAPREIPRPQDKIKTIAKDKMGLILESGREIHWNIVELKLRNSELDISGDIKPRLLAKLQELNIGKRVWDLLK